jgi:transposase
MVPGFDIMFFRIKPSGARRYLPIVETKRIDGKVRQIVRLTVGRMDEHEASGQLARLLSSGARHCEQLMLLSAFEAQATSLTTKRIGAAFLFGRLWQESGIGSVLDALLAGRAFEFPVERAVFATVLHRLMVSGSDRAGEKWIEDYDIPGVEDLALHHLYRAMAWLGEELPEDQQKDATPFAPRTVKDLIEEALFIRGRDLFTDLSVVFMDTTSLYFVGAGGEIIGQRGHSKDYRPQLAQMILGLVIDQEGRPICSEMWPGNTADVTVLIPIIDRLRGRFGIGRVCVVADRGMISTATIAALEERKLEYVLGARERSDRLVRDVVLADGRPFTPLCVNRTDGDHTQLFVKEVVLGKRRYIVCRNEAVAAEDAETKREVIAGLDAQLKRGDKALIGNSAYRRYLRAGKDEAAIPAKGGKPSRRRAFEIDAGKIADEARFDGIFVLRTNARITPLQAVLRYRDLQMVERLFRTAKARMRTRPIYHSPDATIRGHVFCSFLALILHQALDEKLRRAGLAPEWADILRDLDRLEQGEIAQDGKHWLMRTEAGPAATAAFKAARIALPPRAQGLQPQQS